MNTAERAAQLLQSNRFLTLGIADEEGPWVAPINYVIGPGEQLHYYSAIGARHALALESTQRVALAIFDSRAASDDVDGLQAAVMASR